MLEKRIDKNFFTSYVNEEGKEFILYNGRFVCQETGETLDFGPREYALIYYGRGKGAGMGYRLWYCGWAGPFETEA
ncbi:MAG: hypothetical protein Q8N55_03150, partial [bacterium]|nr:hypothetical protein [bacterium]